MRVEPSDGDRKKSLFKCGALVTVVTTWGSYKVRIYCKRWDCPPCKKFRIKVLLKRIGSFSEIFVYTGVVPQGKKHWIERNITGDYIAVRFDSGTIMISEKKFPGCTRQNKEKFKQQFFDFMVPITEGRRISKRRLPPPDESSGDDFPEDESVEMTPIENDTLGIVSGDHVAEIAKMTPVQKVLWLEPQPERIIFPKGKKLLTNL